MFNNLHKSKNLQSEERSSARCRKCNMGAKAVEMVDRRWGFPPPPHTTCHPISQLIASPVLMTTSTLFSSFFNFLQTELFLGPAPIRSWGRCIRVKKERRHKRFRLSNLLYQYLILDWAGLKKMIFYPFSRQSPKFSVFAKRIKKISHRQLIFHAVPHIYSCVSHIFAKTFGKLNISFREHFQ